MLTCAMPTPSILPQTGTRIADNADPTDARLAPLAESIAVRLGAACRDWNAAEFDALVRRIARTKLRWTDLGYGD